MPVTLHADELADALERAYVQAIGKQKLSATWLERAERLGESPSVAFIAATGAVLLAKATNPAIDAFVIQAQEGSAGAFNLRAAATALAAKKRSFGYDIGSSSDRDPINHGTLVGSTRWDVALARIREDHKPFFSLILTWLHDINRMGQDDATEALAAFIRVRRAAAPGAAVSRVPQPVPKTPPLTGLIGALDGFVGADPEGGARGMALVAAAHRAAGFQTVLPSRNDPRRIDVAIKRNGATVIAAEVKQVETAEGIADTLAKDAADADVSRALLTVLRPGVLVSFDRTAVIARAEQSFGAVLRVTDGVRELLHEAFSAGDADLGDFCASLPHAFAEALCDIRVAERAIETWAAIASRWR